VRWLCAANADFSEILNSNPSTMLRTSIEIRKKISELKFGVPKVPKIENITLAHFRHFSSF
jgi:hypothetical protein